MKHQNQVGGNDSDKVDKIRVQETQEGFSEGQHGFHEVNRSTIFFKGYYSGLENIGEGMRDIRAVRG